VTSARRTRTTGILLVVAAGCSFASIGIFNRLGAARGVGIPTALTLRFSLAALLLWAVALPRQRLRVPLRRLAGLALLGALFVTEASLFFISSRRIPVALTALLLYLYPAWVMLLSWALRGERPGRGGLAALGLALAGISLAIGFPAHHLDLLGVLLGLASSLGYACYMFLAARFQRGLAPVVATLWITTFAAVILAAGAGLQGSLHPALPPGAWPSVLGLAVLGTVVPVFLLMEGLVRISPTQASIACTVEPVATALMGALFLGEGLQPLQLAGGGLVIAAVLVLSLADRT
jgi:drug/metabolite transporter (DMT)-like permease